MRSSGCRTTFDLSNKNELIPLFVCFGPLEGKAEETGFYRMWEEICQSELAERIRSKLAFLLSKFGKSLAPLMTVLMLKRYRIYFLKDKFMPWFLRSTFFF